MRPLGIIALFAVIGGVALLALRQPTPNPSMSVVGVSPEAPDATREVHEYEPAAQWPHNLKVQSADHLGVIAQAETERDPQERAAARELWVNAVPVSEIRIVLDVMSPEELSGDAARLLVRRWADNEPYVATAWVESIATVEVRSVLQTALALAWSEKDLESALFWAQGLTVARDEVLTQLGYEVTRINPIRALSLAAPMPPTDPRDELILHALRQWSATDPATAQAWLQEWPDSDLRPRAFADVAIAATELDPMFAATMAATQTDAGPHRDRAVIGVVQRWGQADRPSTLEWVDSFSAGNLQDNSWEQLDVVAGR